MLYIVIYHALRFGWFVHLVDLLPRTCGSSFGRDFVHCHYGHYDSNQLSGGCRVLHLLTWALTCHNFKLWTLFSVVSTLSYAFSSPRRERLSPCRFFPSSLSVCLRPPLRYWSFFARTSSFTITQQRQFSWIRLSSILLALRFGTEIRLCWCWQSLYGAWMLRSTSKVSPFPPRRRPGSHTYMGWAQML